MAGRGHSADNVNIFHSICVLLLDEGSGYADLVESLLLEGDDSKFVVKRASSFCGALSTLVSSSVDVVLVNLPLITVSPEEAVRALTRGKSTAPIVLLADVENEAMAMRAVEQGAQELVIKLSPTDGLLKFSLRSALERRARMAYLERAVRRAENERDSLREVIDKSADALVVVGRDGIVEYANSAAERMLDREAKDLIGLPFGYPTVAGAETEIELLHRDGKKVVAEMRVTSIEWEGREALLAVLRDVTDRKRAHEELLLSEARLAEAQRIAHLGNWVWDITGNHLWWSQEIYRIFGVSEESFSCTYEGFLDCVHPDDREFVKRAVEEALTQGKPYSIDHRIILPWGEERIVHEQAEVTFDEHGTPVRMAGTVQDITELKRVEEELRRHVTQLTRKNQYEKIISAITMSVHQTLNLGEVFRNSVFAIKENVEGVDYVGIYMVEGDDAVLKAHSGLPEWFIERAGRIPRPKGLTWRTIIDKKPSYRGDVEGDTVLGQAGRELGIKSYMSIPFLNKAGESLGCLQISSLKKNAFDLEVLNLLEIIARQIEVAIENARTAEALKRSQESLRQHVAQLSRKSRFESIISAVTRSVHSSIKLEEVLEKAVQAMSENIENVDSVSIYFVEGDRAVLKASRGYPEWFTDRVSSIPFPLGFTWKTLIDCKPRYVEDVERDTVIGRAGRELGTMSYLSMPILSKEGKSLGCININSLRKGAFDEDHLKLLSIVAQQIEVAINNARTAEALKESEELLRRHVAQLLRKNCHEAIINAVTRSVHSSIDLDEVLENAVSALNTNLDSAELVGVYMVEGEEVVLRAQRGFSEQYVQRAGRIPYPRGYTWNTIITGKPSYCPDVDLDALLGPAGREVGIKSYVSMPIKSKGETIGCININSTRKNAFDEDDVRLLEIVAQQIEVAISNAKQAEALRKSEERYRVIFDQSPVGIYIFDRDLRILECNRRLVDIMCSSFDKIIGLDMRRLKDTSFLHAMEEVFSDKSSYHEGLYHATTSPIVLWLSAYFLPLHDSMGNVIGGMGVVEDITVRKEFESKLKEQAELLDKARDAIFVLDLSHNVVFWNKGAERLYGWTKEEVLGRSFTRLISPIPMDVHRQVVELGEWNGDIIQTSRDGKEKVVESRMTLVRDERGGAESILVINTDVTERKRLEEQFLRSQRLENIGILAGGIAHDLNNVLQPIMMSLQMLRPRVQDSHGQKLIDILQTAAQRGADLVKQVLSFARGLESERIPINIGHVVFSIEKIIKHTFPKTINIQIDIEKELWNVLGDSTQLHQVIMNLCVNSRDAMPEGGTLSISARNVYIDEEFARNNIDARVGPYVVLSVSDTGVGIRPEIMDKIFIPFFSTKEPTKGTGLGLPTAFGIVKNHGGFIKVESELGRGSVFKVYLPAIEHPRGYDVIDSGSPMISGDGELIMVVDDEPSILEIAKEVLDGCGYRVITAKDGVEAVALCKGSCGEIKAVIVDMMMSGKGGLETIRELHRINPSIKIIATSGLREDERVAEVAGADVAAFLWKPFTSEKLSMTLAKVLGKSG